MGTTTEVKEYEKEMLKRVGLGYLQGMEWVEFGDQVNTDGISEKKILTAFGITHTSFDLNERNGSIKVNLDNLLPDKYYDRFNIATNYGTIEHINNQYMAFKNFHNSVKIGGIMIHGFPLIGFWKGHCRYYYNPQFVRDLSQACDYKIVDLRIIDYGYFKGKPMVYATIIKKKVEFISEEEFSKLPIYDSGDNSRTGHYDSKFKRLIIKILKFHGLKG